MLSISDTVTGFLILHTLNYDVLKPHSNQRVIACGGVLAPGMT